MKRKFAFGIILTLLLMVMMTTQFVRGEMYWYDIVFVEPEVVEVYVGEQLVIFVGFGSGFDPPHPIIIEFSLGWDPSMLEFVEWESSWGSPTVVVGDDNMTVTVGNPGIDTDLIWVVFEAKAVGSTILDLYDSNVAASDGYVGILPITLLPSIHNIDTGLNYTTIQEAINAPETLGDHTILVEAGTYFEHVVVNKSINLIGENKNNTIIDGSRAGTVVKVTADNVSISGLTVQNSGHMGSDSGILLYDVSFSNISDNIVTSNKYGIRLDWSNNNSIRDNIATNSEHGIHISYFSSNNTVAENTAGLIWMQAVLDNIIVDNNVNGIGLYDGCNSNKLARNNIRRNGDTGILLYAVSNNLLINNSASSNTGYGIRFFRSHNNILYGNNASNNSDGIYMDESNGNNLTKNIVLNNGRGICVHYYSDDNILVGNIVSNNQEGIRVSKWTNNNHLVNNIVSSNTGYGIRLWDARNNVITGNIISNNLNGISLEANSHNNLFFHNNIIDNVQQAVSDGSSSIWDNGYPSGGNYWSDYEERYPDAEELDGSGIWDTPYLIDENNQDNYPLMNPWSPFPPTVVATADVVPNTLNLENEGQRVTCYIELPESYNVSDIDVSSILLNDTIPVDDGVPTEIGDYDSDGIPDLMVQFNRTELTAQIYHVSGVIYGDVTLTITGQLTDGAMFEGSETIEVLFGGDADLSGYVETADFFRWRENFGKTPDQCPPGLYPDFDDNGLVAMNDFFIWRMNFGATVPPPP